MTSQRDGNSDIGVNFVQFFSFLKLSVDLFKNLF